MAIKNCKEVTVSPDSIYRPILFSQLQGLVGMWERIISNYRVGMDLKFGQISLKQLDFPSEQTSRLSFFLFCQMKSRGSCE